MKMLQNEFKVVENLITISFLLTKEKVLATVKIVF
jgi:hypothetical protein